MSSNAIPDFSFYYSSKDLGWLGKTYSITCVAPSYLKQAGVPQTPEAIADHRCVNFMLPQSGREISWKFEQDGAALLLPITSYLQ